MVSESIAAFVKTVARGRSVAAIIPRASTNPAPADTRMIESSRGPCAAMNSNRRSDIP